MRKLKKRTTDIFNELYIDFELDVDFNLDKYDFREIVTNMENAENKDVIQNTENTENIVDDIIRDLNKLDELDMAWKKLIGK